jgi:glycosyltransferase involved in cell wall biosynthesis
MPGVLIEAGLSAVPVVATAVPGVGAIVADGETGCVVGIDDFDAMVEATAGLLTDGDRRLIMGEAARRWCLERFSMDVVAAGWREALVPMLAGP